MKMFNRKSFLTAALALLAAAGASAQSSDRPIRMIVPFAAGGANDLIARALQKPLGDALGASVVVINQPGGSTKIAVQELLRAPPDGNTLLLAGHAALLGYYYSGIYEDK